MEIRTIWPPLKASYLTSSVEIIKYNLVKRKKSLGKKKALEGQIKVQMKNKTFHFIQWHYSFLHKEKLTSQNLIKKNFDMIWAEWLRRDDNFM